MTLAVLLLVGACSVDDGAEDASDAFTDAVNQDTSVTTTADTSDTDTAEVDCSTVEATECSLYESCTVIEGRSVTVDANGVYCIEYDEPSEPKGCGPAGVTCPASIKYAAPASDPSQCYAFGDCLPLGWVACAQEFSYRDPACY